MSGMSSWRSRDVRKNERVDGVKWEGVDVWNGGIGGKEQASLLCGSQKGAMLFQMKKDCSY
jgi:hypothetical protein